MIHSRRPCTLTRQPPHTTDTGLSYLGTLPGHGSIEKHTRRKAHLGLQGQAATWGIHTDTHAGPGWATDHPPPGVGRFTHPGARPRRFPLDLGRNTSPPPGPQRGT